MAGEKKSAKRSQDTEQGEAGAEEPRSKKSKAPEKSKAAEKTKANEKIKAAEKGEGGITLSKITIEHCTS